MSKGMIADKTVSKVAQEAFSKFSEDLRDAYAQCLESTEKQKSETLAEVKRILNEAEKRAATIVTQSVAKTELSARNMSLQVIEEIVDDAFHGALAALERRRGTETYGELLTRLLNEGLDMMSGAEFVLSSSKTDHELLKKITEKTAKERKVKITVAPEPVECCGGVIVRSSDGSVSYDNTFEARLERLRPVLRTRISGLLSKSR